MEFIFNTPYVIRVLASLVVILLVNKITKQLSLSILAGTLTIALWTGQSFMAILSISWDRFSSANNIFLMVVVSQVIWLSTQMSLTGMMKDLVGFVSSRVSQRNAMAILPAVIGLLPMPGGAVFSAPLVDDLDHGKDIDPELKARINYWFRHIWEYWWPLYPGIILAVDITGLSIIQVMLVQLPLCLTSIICGYVFLLRKIKSAVNKDHINNSAKISEFIKLISPIGTVIICYALVRILLPGIAVYNKYLPMIIGIFVAQILLQIQRPLDSASWKKIVVTKNTIMLAFVVALIRVYGAFIEASLSDGTLLMSHVRIELGSWGIPIIFIIMLIPFISGLTTGISVGFVGASFPIIMSLVGVNPDPNILMATTVLAFASGFMGVILSPVHVCLIVTCGHFRTQVIDCLMGLVKPAVVVIAVAVILFFVLG